MSKRPKCLFLVTEDSYFYSHRKPMVDAAQAAGMDVVLVTNVQKHGELIKAWGVKIVHFSLERRSLNPFKALIHLGRLISIYREEAPYITHHIAMKPILLGSLASIRAKVPRMVNAFAGLGYLFTENTFKARLLRFVTRPFFKFGLTHKSSALLLQNTDDYRALNAKGFITKETEAIIISGSGIDLEVIEQKPLPPLNDKILFAFAGRMIAIKGLQTLKDAFEILQNKAPEIELWLCGAPDKDNPGHWDDDKIEEWVSNCNNVTYKGYCTDMSHIWTQVHGAIQVSYGGEGLPKSLLDAAAHSRMIIASDVPGCREVVADDVNGYLVPARDADALANALLKTVQAADKIEKMGKASYKLIKDRGFDSASVTSKTTKLYKSLLSDTD